MHRLVTAFIFTCTTALAQTGAPVLYRDMVFTNTEVTKDLSYAMRSHNDSKEKYFRFDLYQPAGDVAAKRPLIIWLHGGGFKFGSKKAEGVQLWSQTFAQRGYVCAALNYRLSKENTLFNFPKLRRACYDAVSDVDEAISYFKQHASEYRIDTNRIIVAGNSAGGMIALQAAYSNRAEFASMVGAENVLVNTGKNPSHIAAVVNFWGGLFNIEWLNKSKVPLFTAYGDQDKIVPVDRKDTSLYGAISIHAKANEQQIPNELKVYEGYSHELQKHFNPIFGPSRKTKERWLDLGQRVADFLWREHMGSSK